MTGREPYYETAPLSAFALTSVLIGTLACWPAFLNGGPLVFFDIEAYLSNGAAMAQMLGDMFGTSQTDGTVTDATGDAAADRGRSIRSIVYSAFVYFGALTPLGTMLPLILQSTLIAGLVLLLVPSALARRPLVATGALMALMACTPWPFYASLLMPDLLAAAIVLGAMILVRGTNRRGHILVGLALAVALSSHYGNPPLALVVLGATGLWLLFRRRLTMPAALCITLPFVVTIAVNLAGSLVAFGETSVAPRRLPILLARSLEDGPARWHLADHCDTYDYQICTALPEIPENVGAALWQENGIASITSAEVMNRIRAEERILLWRAFLDYPAAQSWSLGRNAALQLVRFGLSDVYTGDVTVAADGTYVVVLDRDSARALLDRLEWLHGAGVALSILIMLVALRRGHPGLDRPGAMLVILCLGLCTNAAIFGGLSAPVDRYQGRIIWLLPLLALLLWTTRQRDRGDQHA